MKFQGKGKGFNVIMYICEVVTNMMLVLLYDVFSGVVIDVSNMVLIDSIQKKYSPLNHIWAW